MKARLGGLMLAALLPLAAPASDLFTHPASAEELRRTLLADTVAELEAATVLTGTFIQRRVLREIPRPLVASGDFLLAREAGVSWHTRTPFDTEFVLTRSGMTLRDGGTVATHVDADRQPGLRAAVEIFFALFSLDLATLERSFTLYGQSGPSGWQVGLRPKTALRTVFREAVIFGSRQIESIQLEDGNGDRIEIELHQLEARAGALTAEQLARFN